MRPTSQKGALVRNAADADQVKRASKREQFAREEEMDDLRVVMSTMQGRRFLWERLGKLGVNKSVFVTSSEIYYRAGRQDAGHQLLADILDADSEGYLLMQREAIAREQSDTTEPQTTQDHE